MLILNLHILLQIHPVYTSILNFMDNLPAEKSAVAVSKYYLDGRSKAIREDDICLFHSSTDMSKYASNFRATFTQTMARTINAHLGVDSDSSVTLGVHNFCDTN